MLVLKTDTLGFDILKKKMLLNLGSVEISLFTMCVLIHLVFTWQSKLAGGRQNHAILRPL